VASKSQATETQTDSNTNVVLDRDTVMRDGQMISESIIIDPSDATMQEIARQFQASFQLMLGQSRAGMQDMLGLARSLQESVDKNQIRMTEFGYQTLQASVEFMQTQLEQGKYVAELSDAASARAYDLAGAVVGNQNDTVARALEIVSEVETGDFTKNLQSLTGMIMIFALGAIYLMRKK
jgi:hypothetical protein